MSLVSLRALGLATQQRPVGALGLSVWWWGGLPALLKGIPVSLSLLLLFRLRRLEWYVVFQTYIFLETFVDVILSLIGFSRMTK